MLTLTLAAELACAPRSDPPEPETKAAEAPAPAEPSARLPRPFAPTPDERAILYDPAELAELPTSPSHLDIALAPADRITLDRQQSLPDAPADACLALDPAALGPRLAGLGSLRISGCPAAAAASILAGAGGSLRSLELANTTVDAALLEAVAALPDLEALALVRVTLAPAAGLPRQLATLERLTLRELETDSALAGLIARAPRLRQLELIGAWAGHKAMLEVDDAARLERLALIETRVGNFSLHQLKGLERLTALEWRGATFNDKSPLYVRELPIESLTCACPSFGDGGLRHLRHLEGLRELRLLQSTITGAGLVAMGPMARLTTVAIHERDPGVDGLAALAEQTALVSLELIDAELADPSAQHLERLTGLTRLALRCPAFDDRGAARLSALTHLEQLDLGGTQLSDRGLKHLAPLTELRTLKLHHTRITNRGLASLEGLTRLEELELDHTDLVDEGVAHLAGLTALRSLRLDHTLVTDAGVAHLVELRALERLNLSHTVVSAAGADQLAALPALRVIGLEGTRAARGE
ncbi:MAG: hypothetical protein R3A51_07310 [Nannocystaceae bacterium]